MIKQGDLLLEKLQAEFWLEELKRAVIYREKMRRMLYWMVRNDTIFPNS